MNSHCSRAGGGEVGPRTLEDLPSPRKGKGLQSLSTGDVAAQVRVSQHLQ